MKPSKIISKEPKGRHTVFSSKRIGILVACILLAMSWGCDNPTSLIDGQGPPSEPLSPLEITLNDIRSATSEYQSISEAEAAGYTLATSFVPNMGYHYVKKELVQDGTVDLLQPEALVYTNLLRGDEAPGPPSLGKKMKLIAVEYIYPGTGEEKVSELPDLFEQASEDRWQYDESGKVWTLHVWVYAFNPEGLFHDTNPNILN